jgi:electron transfer flavoprotein alpha subunit
MSGVWVWIEQHNGKVANASWEALGLARTLGNGVGEPVTAVVFGDGAGEIGKQAIQRGADNAIASDDAT